MLYSRLMIYIRPSNANDRTQIHEVRKASWRKAYRGILPVIQEATSDQVLSQPPKPRWSGLQQPDEITQSRVGFVAIKNGNIVGFVAGGLPRQKIADEDCELWAIYVHPDQQKQNIGRLLLNDFKNAMQAKGKRKMILWTLRDNQSSRHFYETLGGQLYPKEKMFQWNDEDIAIEVPYLWILD